MNKKIIIPAVLIISFAVLFTACTLKKSDTALDSTANWKTYTNNEYGFEIKYPSDFMILNYSSANDWHLIIQKPQVDIYEIEVSKNANMSSFEYSEREEPIKVEEITLGGIKGKKIQRGPLYPADAGPRTSIIIYIVKGENTYIFYENYGEKPDEGTIRFNQMLSTFRFIDNLST